MAVVVITDMQLFEGNRSFCLASDLSPGVKPGFIWCYLKCSSYEC